jgi:site-specific recombinase XerD
MNSPYFQSFLATFLDTFVQYKRALNRKYCADVAVLQLFDRYLSNRPIARWQGIDSASIDDFLESRHRVSSGSYNHLLGILRRFFAFAVMQGWIQQSPVTARARPNIGGRIPFLFDLEAAKRLLAVARGLPERSMARHRGLVYETVFALLYFLAGRNVRVYLSHF